MSLDRRLPVRLVWFYVGLLVMVAGYAMVIKAGLGATPWDIFHIGVQGRTGGDLGLIIQLTGVAIILLNMALGIRPTIGMLLNVLSVGPLLEVWLTLLPVPEVQPGRWLMLLAGILLSGVGTALYVSADIGSGPRDGMMIGVTRKLNLPVGVVKNGLDVVVALAGWWLGGPLGLGTVMVALGLGPAVQLGVYLVARLANVAPFSGFIRPVSLKRT